ncbi:MAG TPA: dienelactone hydrolase family protein [Gemmatimonadaceae bacterium]|jgi:carboxymethylenebutenolidase|nr:dienelactone hydrolase family protein [Gemmatimonadaceae bacterium]
MSHTELQIETADGHCPTHVYHPSGNGPWPGVIMYMDGIGMRPALMEIAERIANSGYYVLLPNLFYRVDFDASNGMKVFTDPDLRKDLMTRVMPSASAANVMRDTETLFAHLAAQREVEDVPIGVTGYCMGGRLAVYAAGYFGDRIVAAASYHGGGLATDAPDSPHRLAPHMTARVYVAGATKDPNFDDAQKARLEQALTEADVDHTIETYNAMHGFVPRDTPVHDEAATARHWETLLALFAAELKAGPPQ